MYLHTKTVLDTYESIQIYATSLKIIYDIYIYLQNIYCKSRNLVFIPN
jgi:hypothetical protein